MDTKLIFGIIVVVIVFLFIKSLFAESCVMLRSNLLGEGDPVSSDLDAMKTFSEVSNLSMDIVEKLPLAHVASGSLEDIVYKGVLLEYGYYFEFEDFKYQFFVDYSGKVYVNQQEKIECPSY